VQVHKEKWHKNPAKSYMWVFSSSEFEQVHPIRLYEYQPSRSGSYAEEFLKGFNGILQTDGYTGYQKAPCQAHALCCAHCKAVLRRSHSARCCRKKTSSAASAKKPSSGSPISLSSTKGLQNSRKKSAKNSVCERTIRNFTIGRKNWLFSDSPKGAKASAAVYSIIETAKTNGLNPFQYLKYLFEHLPNADIQRHPEHLDDVLPWNEIIQKTANEPSRLHCSRSGAFLICILATMKK